MSSAESAWSSTRRSLSARPITPPVNHAAHDPSMGSCSSGLTQVLRPYAVERFIFVARRNTHDTQDDDDFDDDDLRRLPCANGGSPTDGGARCASCAALRMVA